LTDSFQSNLHASRLENLLESASNADTMLNGPLKALTNDILWESFERYRYGTNYFVYLQQDIDILQANLVKVSKKIQSMNNKDLLGVIKTNHLYGIKSTINYILKPLSAPSRSIDTITPRPFKGLAHSISTRNDHLV